MQLCSSSIQINITHLLGAAVEGRDEGAACAIAAMADDWAGGCVGV